MLNLFDRGLSPFRFFIPVTTEFWPLVAAIFGGLFSAVSTASQIRQQNDAAQAQQESIAATTRMNYALKQQQEMEAKAQAGQKASEEHLKRIKERGKLQAAQAESGVAGASPLREMMSSYVQQSITTGSIVAEGEAKQRAIGYEMQSQYLQGLSQINQLESQKTSGGAALFSTLFSGASGALSGYSMANSIGSLGLSSTTSASTVAGTTSTTGVSYGLDGTMSGLSNSVYKPSIWY